MRCNIIKARQNTTVRKICCNNKVRVLLHVLVLHIFRVIVVVDVIGVFVLYAVAMCYVRMDWLNIIN